jgi:hypothetical protein
MRQPQFTVPPIAETLANAGASYTLDLTNYFTSLYGSTLNFTVKIAESDTGLVYDAVKREVSGVPKSTAIGVVTLDIKAFEENGEAYALFEIIYIEVAEDKDPAPQWQGNTYLAVDVVAGVAAPSTKFAAMFYHPDAAKVIKFTLSGLPTGSGLFVQEDGTLGGTPTLKDAAASPFQATLTATGSPGKSTEKTVNFVVTVDDTIVIAIVIPPIYALEKEELSFNLKDYVFDSAGSTITFKWGTKAPDAASGLVISSEGVLSGTPSAEFSPYALDLVATTLAGVAVYEGPISLLVVDGEAPPVASPIPEQTLSQGESFQLDFSDFFLQPNDLKMTFAITGLPAADTGLVFSSNGKLSGLPNANDKLSSPMALTVTATDTSGNQASTQVTLTIMDAPLTARNGIPKEKPGTVTTIQGTAGVNLVFDLRGLFNDPDGDVFSVMETARSTLPLGLTITASRLQGIPQRGGTFSVVATDAAGGMSLPMGLTLVLSAVPVVPPPVVPGGKVPVRPLPPVPVYVAPAPAPAPYRPPAPIDAFTPVDFNDKLIFSEIEATFKGGVLDAFDRDNAVAAFCQVIAEGMSLEGANVACRAKIVAGRTSVYRFQASPADEKGRTVVVASLGKPMLYEDTLQNGFVLASIIKAGFAPTVHKVMIHDAKAMGIRISPTVFRAPVPPSVAPITGKPTGAPSTRMPTSRQPTKQPTTREPTGPTPQPTKTFSFNSFAECVGSCVTKLTKGACQADQSVRWGKDCNNLLKGPCRVECGASSLLSVRETLQLEAVFGFDADRTVQELPRARQGRRVL